MLKILNKNLLFFLTMTLFVGCNYNQQKKSNTGDEIPQIVYSSGAELSYKQISDTVLARRCFECHSNQGGNKGKVNLETYQNVFANKIDIRNDLLDKSMPKGRTALSEYETKLVIDWIDAGANEFPRQQPIIQPPVVQPPVTPPVVAPTPVPVVVPVIPEDQIDYAVVTKYVLQTNCTKCHSDKGGNKGKVNLETYENVFKNRDEVFNQIMSGEMPPPPPKGIALTDEQAKLILKWIELGAPEKANPASSDLSENTIELELVNK